MRSGKTGFVAGFAAATVLLGAVAAFSVGELYTTNPEGDWIRDITKYAPGTADQINVLGDLQPRAPQVMFDIGLRLNVLAAAGKKQNWDVAGFEADEIEEAFGRLIITAPGLETGINGFLSGSLDPVKTAIANKDKTAFTTALDGLTGACNTCHTANAVEFMKIKPGKPGLPLQL